MIVLNIYNGDILGIHENIEYTIWYSVPLLCNIYVDHKTKNFNNFILDYNLLLMGIISNVYWYTFQISEGDRHRTEYYDTQCLLCGISYYTMIERSRILIRKE